MCSLRMFLSAVLLRLLSALSPAASTITTSTPTNISNASLSHGNNQMLRVGTWNILLPEDEYNPSWGCPIQIHLCGSTQESRTNCTRQRQLRIWEAIEHRADDLDVLCLQEVEDTFLELQPREGLGDNNTTSSKSSWEMVARSGECAIFVSESSRQQWELVNATDVYMPSLSGCPSVPMISLEQRRANNSNVVNVASLHVKASVSNMTAWYESAADAIDQRIESVEGYSIILGGDFNHNMTRNVQLPTDWDLVHSDTEQLQLKGTTQKEYNWMGMFDGFLVRHGNGTLLLQDVSTVTAGFMPKVVHLHGISQGLVQRVDAQFKTEYSSTLLLFSETGQDPFEAVPQSNPKTEALSDHLLVTAVYLVP